MMEQDNKILVTHDVEDDIILPLKSLAYVQKRENARFDPMCREEVMKNIEDVVGIINQGELKVNENLLNKAKRLKIVANASIGYDNLDLDLMKKYGIWASNAPGFFDYPVAEYVIGGMIAVSRNMIGANHFVRSGQWNKFEPGRWDGHSLHGKTLGIVGMGSIGEKVANLAMGLGMNITYYSRRKDPHSNPAFKKIDFEELLTHSDFISVHVPLNSETKHMFTGQEFSLMKQGVIFINTSRGKVVKEEDLVQALREKKMAGAVLDVFENEPDVSEELLNFPNLLLTPHMAGGSKHARRASHQQAINNVIEVLEHRKPLNPLLDLV